MTVSEVSHDEWRECASLCAWSSIYQDPRWLELIGRIYPNLRVRRLVCRDSAGQLLWILPLVDIVPLGKRLPMMISLPFVNYCGFMAAKNRKAPLSDDEIRPLADFFNKSRAFAIEIRETDSPPPGFQVEDGFRRFVVEFPDNPDELWNKTITGNARTCVRKADKAGVKAVFGHPDAVAVFQDIYERNSSSHGTPIHHPRWYFELEAMFRLETEIVLAEHDGKFIAALFMLHHGDTTILHAAVSDSDFRKASATDKLLWASYERLQAGGKIRKFDFGRTRAVGEKHFFKKKWGGVEQPLYYAYMLKPGSSVPRILPENPKLGPAIRAWKMLPMAVKRFIGPWFRVRIPT